jgi:hypothetical protein
MSAWMSFVRCNFCPGTDPCACSVNQARRDGPLAEDICRLCETPIGRYGGGVGWHHIWPLAAHSACGVANAWPDIVHSEDGLIYWARGHLDRDLMARAVERHLAHCAAGTAAPVPPHRGVIRQLWLFDDGSGRDDAVHRCQADWPGAEPWTQLVATVATRTAGEAA